MNQYPFTPEDMMRECAWNTNAAREQASRAIRAEQQVDMLTAVIAEQRGEIERLRARIAVLEGRVGP